MLMWSNFFLLQPNCSQVMKSHLYCRYRVHLHTPSVNAAAVCSANFKLPHYVTSSMCSFQTHKPFKFHNLSWMELTPINFRYLHMQNNLKLYLHLISWSFHYILTKALILYIYYHFMSLCDVLMANCTVIELVSMTTCAPDPPCRDSEGSNPLHAASQNSNHWIFWYFWQ